MFWQSNDLHPVNHMYSSNHMFENTGRILHSDSFTLSFWGAAGATGSLCHYSAAFTPCDWKYVNGLWTPIIKQLAAANDCRVGHVKVKNTASTGIFPKLDLIMMIFCWCETFACLRHFCSVKRQIDVSRMFIRSCNLIARNITQVNKTEALISSSVLRQKVLKQLICAFHPETISQKICRNHWLKIGIAPPWLTHNYAAFKVNLEPEA